MKFFESLHVFQRYAALKGLAASDRLVYINLLIRADLESSETFYMTANDLAFYTGLHRNTVYEAKERLKRHGIVDFKKAEITLCKLDEKDSAFGVSRKTPTPPKKNKKAYKKMPVKDAGAREKNSVGPGKFSITKPAVEWV